ncbi:hypothetical protein BJY00DRAFT_297823 [Aspergillus carlsbadensis]|nr:hypothetical protein BJY00DRAFT_297823 [Aspergillus carlsbadensis]
MPKRKRRHNPVEDIFKGYTFKPLPKGRPGPDAPAEYHDHTVENGRRYRGHNSNFPWPNDGEAVKAYSSLNTVWTFLLRDSGRDLIGAPMAVPEGGKGSTLKVLDVNARGVWWTSKTEDRYPGARISAIDPDCAWVHPTRFTVYHELEPADGGGWPFTARQAFHYIRGFALGGMVADYEGLYRNAYRHLLPGGWFEVRENDLQFFIDGFGEDKEKEENLIAEAAEKQKAFMEAAGFTEVREEVYKILFGKWMQGEPWTPFIDSTYILHMRHGLECHTLRLFTKSLGWSLEDTMALIRQVQAEIVDEKLNDLRLYTYFRLVVGRKPIDASRKP